MLNNNNFCACIFQTPEKVLSIVCHPLLLRICFGWLSKRGFGHFENSEQEMNLFSSFHSKISPTSSPLSSLIHFLIVTPFHLFLWNICAEILFVFVFKSYSNLFEAIKVTAKAIANFQLLSGDIKGI